MTHQDQVISLNEWLRIGRDLNYCTNIVCEIHDGVPLTQEEEDAFEEGEDPCVFVVRINTDRLDVHPFSGPADCVETVEDPVILKAIDSPTPDGMVQVWPVQIMGTWEVHDESHVMTQEQYDAIARRANL
jgi:hypothetical protein